MRKALTTETILIILGYSIYHGITLNAYLTNFALTPHPFGYISNTAFMTSATPAVVLTALALYLWARLRRPAPFSLGFLAPLIVLGVGYLGAVVLQGQLDRTLLMYLLGAAWGIATTLGAPAWVEVIAHGRSNLGIILQLALGTFVAALISIVLGMLPEVPTTIVCAVLLAVCYPLMIRCRHQATPFEVDTSEHAVHGALRGALPLLLAYFFFELVCGMVNMFAFKVPEAFQIATGAPILSMLICSVVLVLIVVVTAKTPNPSLIYVVVLPAVIAIFLLLPFFGGAHGHLLSTVIYSAYMITSLLAFYRYVISTRENRADVYRVVALITLFGRLFLYAGILMGHAFGTMSAGEDFVHLSIVVVVCIYCLGLVIAFWMLRSHRETTEAAAAPRATYEQTVARRADELARRCALTNRERDVLIELSRGNSAARVAENLCLSTSTVQGYIKSLYAKLGVHSRQQVLDLFTADDEGEMES